MIKYLVTGILFLFTVQLEGQENCKKLTRKRVGAGGNDCCIEDASLADSMLISAQLYWKDSLQKVHAPFGLPTSKNPHVVILYAPHYVCGYDTVFHVPIWVQYKMSNSSERDNELTRVDCFRPDPRLPANQQISHADYTRSGFDRGHLKPADDSKKNLVEHLNSFVMSNMAPQCGYMNRQEWRTIESYVNGVSRQDSVKRAYMITGSVVDENPKYIYDKVAVPSWFYKIFFFQSTSGNWYYWVFYVKNDDVRAEIRDFENELLENLKSIDELELLTSTNFYVARRKQKKIEGNLYSGHLFSGMFSHGYSSSYSDF
ncbi:MAG: DNA/RNA non-specific endonuclease [Crocinitomicaceae bacterium]|nr:DNA/RNA non-specific endonuclease [Crocinitomicaceae bacterium]